MQSGALDTALPVAGPEVELDLAHPYRMAADVRDVTRWWPERPGDPRRTVAWASGTRRPGDDVRFIGAPAGPAMWTRCFTGPGQPRMNAVDVSGGIVNDLIPDEALVSRARAACERQVVVAANGYVSPVIGDDGGSEDVLREVIAAARRAHAVPALLHYPADGPLVPKLAGLGLVAGITDLYGILDLPGTGFDDYLAALPSSHRVNIRRERRSLDRGRGAIYIGPEASPHLSEAAKLAAISYDNRGQHADPTAIRAVYARLLDAFGDRFALSMVELDGEPVASTVLIVGDCDLLAYSAGFRLPEARQVAGYFNAAYYLPIDLAYARGSRRLLLGTTAIEAKRLRGAKFQPLISAVPRTCGPLVALLAATDARMRQEAQRLAQAGALATPSLLPQPA